MAVYTLSELYTAVLEDLGVVAAGQAASAADTAAVTQATAQVLDELEDENLVDWDPTANSIPSDRFLPLVDIIAQQVAPKFGKPRDMAVQTMATNRLRRRAAKNSDTEPVSVTYY